jgi:geranylgeranyl reductase family protein
LFAATNDERTIIARSFVCVQSACLGPLDKAVQSLCSAALFARTVMVTLPVLVAGGGPGGSATAISLCRHGVPVILLDRQVFPRDKVCGDVVLPEAQEAMQRLALPMDGLKAHAYPCTGSRYVSIRGRQISGAFRDMTGRPTSWWMVKRAVLDHWLLQQAKGAGAEIREGWEVCSTVQDSSGQVVGVHARRPDGEVERIEASAVVGADGATSAVARSLGCFHQKADHLCLAARAYVRGVLPDPYLEIFTTERTLPGCTWIVPVGPDEWNVGVGIIKADAERRRVSPRQLFDEVREHVPLFNERLRGVEVGSLKGWSLPGSSEGRPIVGKGHLLVGDAGAMVDPFTGHGIHHALMAGNIAGEVLANALSLGNMDVETLLPYDQQCRKAFLDDAMMGHRLQRLHAHATLMRMATALCGAHPGFQWVFMSLLGHVAPRHQILNTGTLLKALFTRGPRPAVTNPNVPSAQVTA